jgi:hypothetical protein
MSSHLSTCSEHGSQVQCNNIVKDIIGVLLEGPPSSSLRSTDDVNEQMNIPERLGGDIDNIPNRCRIAQIGDNANAFRAPLLDVCTDLIYSLLRDVDSDDPSA